MTRAEFRKELQKIMPGYSWTVHLNESYVPKGVLFATGIQSSGFNRISTLSVTRVEREYSTTYDVKSSGFGLKAGWLEQAKGETLARALRSLQNIYLKTALKYNKHANDLELGRIKKNSGDAS